MKMILYSLKVCLYQIRIMSKNYKIYTIPVCLFIFMKSFLDPFREFLNDPDRVYGMEYAGYEIKFRVKDRILTVCEVEGADQDR